MTSIKRLGTTTAWAVATLISLPAYSQRPVYLTGRVMLVEGTPPPRHVAIQLQCGGLPVTEGYTDSHGYFNIRLGSFMPDLFQDASSSPPLPGTAENTNDGLRTRELMNCQLRAQLAGYQSQPINLGRRRNLEDPDTGIILLHSLGMSAAPKDARKVYEKGLELTKKNKLDVAEVNFRKAVALYPRYAAAWCELGKVQAAQGQSDAARASFERSIAADGNFVVPYIEMSALEYRAQQWQQLADTSEKAIALDPFDYPQAFFLNAVANYNLHNLERAEDSAQRAEKVDTAHQIPEASRLLGVILAERHDFTAAAAEMRKYLKLAPQAPDADTVRSQLAQIEQAAKAATAAPPH